GQGLGLLHSIHSGAFETSNLVTALMARALLRAGEGRADDAWQDILAAFRLGRLIQQGDVPVVLLAGMGIEMKAITAAAAFRERPNPGRKRLARYLADLRRLPPPADVVGNVNFSERLLYLDSVQRAARYGIKEALAEGATPQPNPNANKDGLDYVV